MSDKPKKRLFQKRNQHEKTLQQAYARLEEQRQELARTNQALALLQTIDTMAMESHTSLKAVCQHISEAIVQSGKYPLVGLLTRSPRHPEQLILQG